MADAVTSQTLADGDRIAVVKFTNLSDGSGESSVKKLTKKLKKIKNLNYELILIDDGSSDKTNKIINDLKKKNIKIITNSTNLGKSTSLIKGIKLAKFKKIIIIDCDLPYFKYLSELINHLKKHDLVYINRKSPESRLETRKLNLLQDL